MNIAETVAVFKRWLHLPDPDIVLVVLAAVAANMMDGDPVWLLIVGPPGGGKTEILQAIAGLPGVKRAGVLTEASLLSGTPKKEKADGAKGGLLREIGRFGILSLKDFGSVLSMRQESRAALLAALREIFDGEWVRDVGTDGGRRLRWDGKLGLVAGCTPIIDTHHAVLSALGERFVFYRLTVTDSDAQAYASLAHYGHETTMRGELRTAVDQLFGGVDLTRPPTLSITDTERLVALSTLVVRCRSAVERDRQSREIDLVPEAEAPGRLVGVLARILSGARMLGASDEEAWRVTEKVALDSMPAQRLSAMILLNSAGEPVPTPIVAEQLDLPNNTVRRVLEDLTAHHVVQRFRGGAGKADRWTLTPWTSERLRKLHKVQVIPIRMGGDIAETVPLDATQNGSSNGNIPHAEPFPETEAQP